LLATPRRLLHCFPDPPFHLRRHLGGASGQLGGAPLAGAFNVLDEQLHLCDLADLRFDDLVRQLANAGVADARLPRIIDGDGVVGIIDFMKLTSLTTAWPLFSESRRTPSSAATTRTATFVPLPLYIDHMKPSMTIVMTHPITSDATNRLMLNVA
jgi:hypothetical protein